MPNKEKQTKSKSESPKLDFKEYEKRGQSILEEAKARRAKADRSDKRFNLAFISVMAVMAVLCVTTGAWLAAAYSVGVIGWALILWAKEKEVNRLRYQLAAVDNLVKLQIGALREVEGKK